MQSIKHQCVDGFVHVPVAEIVGVVVVRAADVGEVEGESVVVVSVQHICFHACNLIQNVAK